jgi:SAM-dependent methyltransferase
MGVITRLKRWLRRRPSPSSQLGQVYAERLAQELAIFADCVDVNALPDIFHYWSDTYVRPMVEEVGASNPDQFFARFLAQSARAASAREPAFVSIGAGNCDTEVRVAKLLREQGLDRFVIHCLDINPAMLERGAELARAEGVAEHIRPLIGDFNRWRPGRSFDGIMANQSLHHVTALEDLFDSVRQALAPKALFVISDMIGRNGHQRWPEALAAVQTFWRELPDAYRYNQALRRHEREYINWDCSNEGFEGIRAQDIVPALLRALHFHCFIAFGNVVDVFVDRNFGHNFDANADWDRQFVDRLHAFDEAGLAAGELTPTHMMAVLGAEPAEAPFFSRGLTPESAVHPTLRSSLSGGCMRPSDTACPH